MSEQAKGNAQVIGAGILGFVAVVGGSFAVMSLLAPRRPAAPPSVEASAPVPSLEPPAAPRVAPSSHESRQSSPAPLSGASAEQLSEGTAVSPSLAGADPEQAAPAALGALGAPKFAGKGEATSSARAETKKIEVKAAEKPVARGSKPSPRPKLEPSGDAVASAVHYGVTSRSELMGNAAGPVYNFKGGKKAPSGQVAALAGQADAQMADVQKALEQSNLTSEQKAELMRKFAEARGQAAP